ncbi:hypothetical protein Xsto_04146 [Xenorhabdus stockiae]|uniref:ENTH domain-containing protein n=1 Tax=Xenorhabdus stockiae TaxID=351614 RepID=A0A2D0K3A6_9GAMM|nr:hypothetical protein [Xenorhabdus stockiae]PHM56541.1 hypothetical protein Xsto_04146 [Xenorhabdus stockiae]
MNNKNLIEYIEEISNAIKSRDLDDGKYEAIEDALRLIERILEIGE